MRALFQILIPLLLPTVLYLVWVRLSRRQKEGAGGMVQTLSEGPVGWLIASGLVLVIISLVALALTQNRYPSTELQPSEYIRRASPSTDAPAPEVAPDVPVDAPVDAPQDTP